MSEYSFKVIPELYYFHRLRNDSYWHNDNKLSNIEKLNRKIDILKIKLKEILKKFLKKNNTYTDVATYHYHSAAVYYEGLIRNARNNWSSKKVYS